MIQAPIPPTFHFCSIFESEPHASSEVSPPHQWKHHNVWKYGDNLISYQGWLEEHHRQDLEKMEILRHRYIKYDDDLKAEIIRLCNADKLDELQKLIEEKLGC